MKRVRSASKTKRCVRLLSFVLCAMLLFAGCGKSSSKKDTENSGGDSGSASSSSSKKDKETSKGGDTESSGDDDESDGGSSEDEVKSNRIKLEYADAVKDRARTAGKLGIYFLRDSFESSEEVSYYRQSYGSGATLIVSPEGKTMLVGFANNVGNATTLVKLLGDLGISQVDYAVVVCPTADHTGGISTVLDHIGVGRVLTIPFDFSGTYLYDRMMKVIKGKGIPIQYVTEGQTLSLGSSVRVQILNPPADYKVANGYTGATDASLVMRITYGNSSFLFGGDISKKIEESLISKYGGALKSDVVLMNYFGLATNATIATNTEAWIEATHPKIAVGEGIRITDSDKLVIANYAMVADLVLHTAIDGTCVISTAGDGTYEVQLERERQTDDFMELDTKDGYMTVQ